MIDPKEIKALLIRISKEDEKALEELYKLTYGLLIKVALTTLKDKTYAADVVSEAYAKIYQRIKQYDKNRSGLEWIYQIVKNQAIDYNRWFIKETEEYDDLVYVKGSYITIEEKQKLQLALKRLSEEEYRIIYLRMWERWTLKDIAKEYKYSISTAYRIYEGALEKLREYLKE